MTWLGIKLKTKFEKFSSIFFNRYIPIVKWSGSELLGTEEFCLLLLFCKLLLLPKFLRSNPSFELSGFVTANTFLVCPKDEHERHGDQNRHISEMHICLCSKQTCQRRGEGGGSKILSPTPSYIF